MGFDDSVENASRGMGGDWYKFKEGDNQMRLMSEPLIKVSRFGYGICYEGAPYCQKATLEKELTEAKAKAKSEGKDPSKVSIKMPSQKWCAWAIIRGNKEKEIEDKFAIVELPYGVSQDLLTLKKSTPDEGGFTGWPMPYDINITAKNAGSLKVEYTLIAHRSNTPLTTEEMESLSKLTSVEQILDKMKAKQKEKVEGSTLSYPEEDVNMDDIPW